MLMNNLRKYREDHDIKQVEMANHLKVTQATYCETEKNIHTAKATTLKKIAEYLNISIDFILGLTNDPTPNVYREKSEEYYFSTNYPDFDKLSEEEKRAVIEETKALTERLTMLFRKQGKK